VIGSAIAIVLLTRSALPLWAGVLVSAAASFLLLLVERFGVRHLEALFAVLISTMVRVQGRGAAGLAFAVHVYEHSQQSCSRPRSNATHQTVLPSQPPPPSNPHPTQVAAFLHMYLVAAVPTAEVLRGFLVPQVPRENVGQVGGRPMTHHRISQQLATACGTQNDGCFSRLEAHPSRITYPHKPTEPTEPTESTDERQAVALLGSLLMPHNLYLHSALVQTRRLRAQDDAHRREALAYFGLESALSLLVGRLGCCGCMASMQQTQD
jgi:hypothetical protein